MLQNIFISNCNFNLSILWLRIGLWLICLWDYLLKAFFISNNLLNLLLKSRCIELILWIFLFLSVYQAASPLYPYLSLYTSCFIICIQSSLGVINTLSIIMHTFYFTVGVFVSNSYFIYIGSKQPKRVTTTNNSCFVALWIPIFFLGFKPIPCLLYKFRFQVLCEYFFLFPFRHYQSTTLNFR